MYLMRIRSAFFISIFICRDKTLINCVNERDLLTFFLSYLLTCRSSEITWLDFEIKNNCLNSDSYRMILAGQNYLKIRFNDVQCSIKFSIGWKIRRIHRVVQTGYQHETWVSQKRSRTTLQPAVYRVTQKKSDPTRSVIEKQLKDGLR